MISKLLRGAAMLALLAIGGAARAAETNGLKITWVHGNAAAQGEQRVQAGFSDWLKKSNHDWQMSYQDAGGSAEKTASYIQDAVVRGVDAIIVTMADLRASDAALATARDRKVPVFAVDSGLAPGVIEDVASNDWAMSTQVSAYLLDEIGGSGNIIVLRMDQDHGPRERAATMATILKEYPKVKVLASHDIGHDNAIEDTKRVMRDDATRFGSGITAVWAPSDGPAAAAVDTLSAAGLKAWVTGMDGEPSVVKMVCDPSSMFLATVAQPFERWGRRPEPGSTPSSRPSRIPRSCSRSGRSISRRS